MVVDQRTRGLVNDKVKLTISIYFDTLQHNISAMVQGLKKESQTR